MKSGKKYWSDGTPVAGQQFEYAFDHIGNRTSTKAGGDAVGSAVRAANYTNNSLNQITSRDVPGAADIIGIAQKGVGPDIFYSTTLLGLEEPERGHPLA